MQEIKGGDYESCKNMIYKLALDRYNLMKKKRADVEFDDVLSEAMYIYSLCLTTYKNGKGMKFSTYLYQNLLARLRDYYKFTFKRFYNYEDMNFVDKEGETSRYEDNIISRKYEIDEYSQELIKVAEKELSYEAIVVLKYILSMKWQSAKVKNFPSNIRLANHFGYSMGLTESIMGEIKRFWSNIGWQVA